MKYTIANHYCSNFAPREQTDRPVFNDQRKFCGKIWLTCSWAVPAKVYESLGLPNHIDLYLTSEGHWASTFEMAEHYLLETTSPTEFLAKGAVLIHFASGKFNAHADYLVSRNDMGGWEVKLVPQIEHCGDFDEDIYQ